MLDFVGTHRTEFRFDRRFRALLGGTRSELARAVKDGFPFLPAGCDLQLDAVASAIVLKSIKDAIPSTWRAKVEELRSLHQDMPEIQLAGYLAETGLDLADVYAGTRGWSDLCQDAWPTHSGRWPARARTTPRCRPDAPR